MIFDHPHICGKYSATLILLSKLSGQSPRPWEILVPEQSFSFKSSQSPHSWEIPPGLILLMNSRRLIPTLVGKTIKPAYIQPPITANPHACGKRRHDVTEDDRSCRLIPTLVGKDSTCKCVIIRMNMTAENCTKKKPLFQLIKSLDKSLFNRNWCN